MAEDTKLNTAEAQSSAAPIKKILPTLEEIGFTGNYKHGLDAKGRLIIPTPFRDQLGEKFAVCLSMDFKHIAIYPLDKWIERRDEYIALCAKDIRIRRILDHFTKYSYVDSEMDAQGRLLLPGALRNRFLCDVREVDVNGRYDYIEIEERKESDQDDLDFFEEYPNPLETIASVQKLP